MDLRSDLPYWTVRNGLVRSYPPLTEDVRCDALVVGGGITGALMADELTRRGFETVVVEKRDIGHGSTSASTALLQYEIDTPLHELTGKVGEAVARRAHKKGIQAIRQLSRLAAGECSFRLRPSLLVAHSAATVGKLRQEFEARQAAGLPVHWIDRAELKRDYSIERNAAIRSEAGAEVDPHLLCHRLLHNAGNRGLRVYDRTTVTGYTHGRAGVVAKTDRRHMLRAKAVFFATGYETQEFLPRKIVRLKSTYALISEPVDDLSWWRDRALIWENSETYLYARTTSDHRILVGGEDDGVLNADRRDAQVAAKAQRLTKKFRTLFPKVELEVGYDWSGVFGHTKDGLPYIGTHPAFPRGYFALGFGGNGITFSAMASRILADAFAGKSNRDANLFRFDRETKC